MVKATPHSACENAKLNVSPSYGPDLQYTYYLLMYYTNSYEIWIKPEVCYPQDLVEQFCLNISDELVKNQT